MFMFSMRDAAEFQLPFHKISSVQRHQQYQYLQAFPLGDSFNFFLQKHHPDPLWKGSNLTTVHIFSKWVETTNRQLSKVSTVFSGVHHKNLVIWENRQAASPLLMWVSPVF